MEFGWPVMLWGLLAFPLLLWGYVRVQRNRAVREVAFADAHLIGHLYTRPPALRRHLPVAFYLLAALVLLAAMARPMAAIPLPVNRAAIILAIDVSKSMIGEDVKPSRLKAAQQAALQVLETVPGSTKVGVVVFSDYAQVLVPPTTERETLKEAIAGLKVQQATGLGSAILESLRALPGRKEALGDRLNPPGLRQPPQILQPGPSPQSPPATISPEDLPPAAIIMFSDGVSNFGLDPAQAAALAREGRVKIYGVGIGTPGGSVMTVDGQLVLVPFDPTLLQRIAQFTDGKYYEISATEELKQVYRQLGRQMGWERRRTEITSVLAGGAGLLMLTGGVFSLLWFRRVP